MSTQNGQLSTCERCGTQVFRRCIGEGELDGGFTRWNKFEEYPEGWGLVSIPVVGERRRDKSILVCPQCHDLWDNIVNEHFLRNTELYIFRVKEE